MSKKYPRNMIGYGSDEIKVNWPNNARLALQIVLNYEEGAENSVLHGDKYSETFLSEIIGAQPIKGRHINMESFYEYGSRRGFWRLHKLFAEKKIPVTIFGVAMALERNPEVCKAIINGDVTQIDLDGKKPSGLVQATQILQTVKGIGFTFFDESDIVRHPLVMKIISAYDKGNNQ